MRKNDPELRVLGTSVTLTEALRQRAQQDLGIRIHFEVLDGFDAQRQAVMRQDSFDLYDQWFHSVDFLWPTGTLQPIDTARLTCWDEVDLKSTRLNSSHLVISYAVFCLKKKR